MLDAVLSYHKKRKFKGGCIFGNTALEMADKKEAYRKFINDVFTQWIGWVKTQLEAAIADGKLSANTPVQELSHHIIATLEGGILLSKVSKKPDDLVYTVTCIKKLIECYKNKHTVTRRK